MRFGSAQIEKFVRLKSFTHHAAGRWQLYNTNVQKNAK